MGNSSCLLFQTRTITALPNDPYAYCGGRLIACCREQPDELRDGLVRGIVRDDRSWPDRPPAQDWKVVREHNFISRKQSIRSFRLAIAAH